LLREILREMSWSEGEGIAIADFTVGGGGHLRALLEKNPRPQKIVAVDQDPSALLAAKENLKSFEPIEWVHSNFRKIHAEKFGTFDRILVDLGVSSHQLDTAERGFSFQKEGPLDMRMDPTSGEAAWEWLARCSEKEFIQIMYDYGEESRAKWFAQKWAQARTQSDIRTTKEFVEAFGFTFDTKDRNGRHPMTRVFQAIRMHINQEFQVLQELLSHLPALLRTKGRVSVLSFHSLEDREVKWLLKGKLKQTHKKVIIAEEDEQKENPRSRSAKLRVFEKQNLEG
jgi:16S rRNA (cytosine1402-N4)-methyltransferase